MEKALIAALDADKRADFEERAAIAEFCGGLARHDAERLALKGSVARGRESHQRFTGVDTCGTIAAVCRQWMT